MLALSKNSLKYYRSLKLKKFRRQEKKFIIEGIKFCNEAVNAAVKIDAFLFCSQILSVDVLTNFIAVCDRQKIPYFEISRNALNTLSDTVHSQGILCVANKLVQNPNLKNAHRLLALDLVNDPGNAGTIIRTADWFGVDGILMSENSVDIYNSKVLRSTMGSIFHLPVLSVIDLHSELVKLKNYGFIIYGADVQSELLFNSITYPAKTILLIGSEAHGIRDELLSICDKRIKIPARGKAESLNMAIAAGIILNEMVT